MNGIDQQTPIPRLNPHFFQASEAQTASSTPIFIANRDDSQGGGREWDHATFQTLTHRPTVCVASQGQIQAEDLTHLEPKPLQEALFKNKMPSRHPVGMPTVTCNGKSGEGLLVVPGGPFSLPEEQPRPRYLPKADREASVLARIEHQSNLLRNARNTGQPVLAICGGSWHTARAFGGTTQTSQEFEAKHFAGLPSFEPTDAATLRVAHHKLAQHRAQVRRDSLLARIIEPTQTSQSLQLEKKDPQPPLALTINSVHWAHVMARPDSAGHLQLVGHDPMAAHPHASTATRKLLAVNTVAIDDELDPTVEGFETRHGAPIIGLQFHPEAFAGRPVDESAYPVGQYTQELRRSTQLLNYMAKAGDAFAARRNMTREFKNAVIPLGTEAAGGYQQAAQPNHLTHMVPSKVKTGVKAAKGAHTISAQG